MKKIIMLITAAALLCLAAAMTAYASEPVPNAGGSINAVQCDTSAHIPGDINGDRRLTNADLTRLMKYLAGEDVQVNREALDVNGDGRVNNRDLSLLMKRLADPEVEIF